MTANPLLRSMSTEQTVKTAPLRIGRYAIYSEIAAGGMATVHLGRLIGPVGFSRTVAIKRLHAQFARDQDFVAMFLDEARLAARIQHPNVVQTLDVIVVDGELLLVMEYIAGETLSHLLRDCKKLGKRTSPRVISSVIAGVLHGLHAAHGAKSERGEPLGIVHRDISPQNVLVGVDGVARVLDFGIAKAATRIQTTRGGQLKGKLSYMSPEQLSGIEADRRTDVFAVGIVLWEALTGRRLFQGNDRGELTGKVMNMPIPAPSEIVPSLPSALDAVVLRSLARDRDERFQDAREFAVALEKAASPAIPRQVGEWVEAIVGDRLAARAETVAEIESVSAVLTSLPGDNEPTYRDNGDPAQRSHPSLPPILMSGIHASTGAGVAEPISQASYAEHTASIQSRRRRTLSAVALCCAVLLGVALFALKRRAVPPGESPTQVSSVEPPAARPEPPPEAAPAKQPEPAASAEVAADSAAPAPSPALRLPRKRDQPARTSPAETRAPPPNCSPPYRVDENGIKRLKPECL
jgi:eukaryotic-like serine/threonine-protein kinase